MNRNMASSEWRGKNTVGVNENREREREYQWNIPENRVCCWDIVGATPRPAVLHTCFSRDEIERRHCPGDCELNELLASQHLAGTEQEVS